MLATYGEELLNPYHPSCAQSVQVYLKALKEGKTPVLPDRVQCTKEFAALSWLWLRENSGAAADHVFFLRTYPDWPDRQGIQMQAELSLAKGSSSEEILQYFKEFGGPLTAEGAFAYARVALKLSQQERNRILGLIWQSVDFLPKDTVLFFRHYKKYLSAEDCQKRIDRLIEQKNFYGLEALKPLVSKRSIQGIDFFLRLLKKKSISKKQFLALPIVYQKNPGLLYHLILIQAKKGNKEWALQLFRQALKNKFFEKKPILLRKLRNYFGRSLVFEKKYQEAFQALTEESAPAEKECFVEYVEGEFLAAWIALRKKDQISLAYNKFQSLYREVKTPISSAKMAYWCGICAEKRGLKKEARAWFSKGSSFFWTYYGQHCLRKLDKKISFATTEIGRPVSENFVMPLQWQVLDFLAAYVPEEVRSFFLHICKNLSLEEARIFFPWASQNKVLSRHIVLGSKYAGKTGNIFMKEIYPMVPVESFVVRYSNLTPQLILSLIRQESGFDERATSGANAKGLMQLIFSTAHATARKMGISLKEEHLIGHPQLNVALGCFHIAELLSRYEGNVPLALAAYNAGSKNVAKWIKVFGVPRQGEQVLDWIEQIPFDETRTYVQRILETVPIYAWRIQEST